jgi:hypothetical protein
MGAVIIMVALAVGALTGFGLVRKTKMGMILVFVLTGLHLFFVGLCLLALVAEPKEPSVALVLLLMLGGLGFWSVCSVYYYKRRQDFR